MKLTRLQELFIQAKECEATELPAFLRNIQENEPQYFQTLKKLLRYDQTPNPVLEEVVDGPKAILELATEYMQEQTQVRAALLQSGTRIGNYCIEEYIDSGGMGDVYLASHQEHKAFKVALKLIKTKAGSTGNQDKISQFLREASAVSSFNHDNIARIHEIGKTQEGQPFLAMEYVMNTLVDAQGVPRVEPSLPIVAHCNHFKLDLKARIKLIQQACKGVFYAHQKGVLHSDIKPSNLLIRRDGEEDRVKIIDFGVARTLNLHKLPDNRQAAQKVYGTVEYAAPELAQPDTIADMRQDVYSLGAVLFELIAGFPTANAQTLIFANRQARRDFILSKSYPPASQFVLNAGPAIETVALARNTTPATMAKNLKGDLDDILAKALAQAVDARYKSVEQLYEDLGHFLAHMPVNAANPQQPWLYRLKKFSKRNRALALSSGFALFLLSLAIIFFVYSYFQIKQARDQAIEARLEAMTNLQRLQKTNAFYAKIFSSTHIYRDGAEVTLMTVLNRNRQDLSRFANGDWHLEIAVRKILGETYHGLGQYTDASQQFEKAMALGKTVYGKEAREQAELLRLAGVVNANLRHTNEAMALLNQALAIHEKHGGKGDPQRLRVLTQIANVLRRNGQFPQALEFAEEAYTGLQNGQAPARYAHAAATALANVYRALGKLAKAEAIYRQLYEAQKGQYGADDPRTLLSGHNLAGVWRRQGQLSQAAALFREVVAWRSEVLGPHHLLTLSSRGLLAKTLASLKSTSEAELVFRQNLAIYRQKFDPGNRRVLNAGEALATFLSSAKSRKQGLALYEELNGTCRNTGQEDTVICRRIQQNRGHFLIEAQRAEEAVPILTQVLALKSKRFQPYHQTVLLTKHTLGQACLQLGQQEQACRIFEEVAALASKHQADEKPLLLEYLSSWAGCLIRNSEWAEAERLLKRCMALAQPDNKKAPVAALLIRLYERWGFPQKADAYRGLAPQN